MDQCICNSERISVLRRSAYISTARKAVKLCRCISCRKYYIAILTCIELIDDQGLVDAVIYLPIRNAQHGRSVFREIISAPINP